MFTDTVLQSQVDALTFARIQCSLSPDLALTFNRIHRSNSPECTTSFERVSDSLRGMAIRNGGTDGPEVERLYET